MGDQRLCSNCLADGGKGYPIGNDKGSQRDPYREFVVLCEPCREALEAGNFAVLHERYAAERLISR